MVPRWTFQPAAPASMRAISVPSHPPRRISSPPAAGSKSDASIRRTTHVRRTLLLRADFARWMRPLTTSTASVGADVNERGPAHGDGPATFLARTQYDTDRSGGGRSSSKDVVPA